MGYEKVSSVTGIAVNTILNKLRTADLSFYCVYDGR